MVQFDHISAWITVDGRTLDEYSQEFNDELSEMSCWIPSQEGKEFALHFSDETIHYNVCLYYYIDGSTVGGRSLADTAEPRNYISCTGVKSSSETERPFMFSKTQLMEADAIPQAPSTALGEIKVECWSIDVRDEVPSGQLESSAADSSSERETVDATHHVGVGNVRRTKSRLSHEVARRILLASFLFRYRPLEILQARGLAPIAPLDADALPLDPRLKATQDISAPEEATFVDVTLSPDVKNEEDSGELDDSTLVPQKRSASPIILNVEYSDPITTSDDEGDDEERIAALEAELARLRKRARKAGGFGS